MDQSELFKAIIKGEYRMPGRFSSDAQELIKGMLVKDPSMRLGSLAGGAADILSSRFLCSIDMEKVRKRIIKPPHMPKIKDPLDASNFENWNHLDDKMKQRFPKLSSEKESIFAKF
jgi:protein kinase A